MSILVKENNVCCNCIHCIRSHDEKYDIIVCHCDVHDVYLSYAEVMGSCCAKWDRRAKHERID